MTLNEYQALAQRTSRKDISPDDHLFNGIQKMIGSVRTANGGMTMRAIDADALFAVVRGHHDLYKGATNPADKARRDECLQVMCDINDAPTIDAIPMGWLREKMRGYASTLKSTELSAVVRVMQMWQKEQEAR